jgi:hypothetical protein
MTTVALTDWSKCTPSTFSVWRSICVGRYVAMECDLDCPYILSSCQKHTFTTRGYHHPYYLFGVLPTPKQKSLVDLQALRDNEHVIAPTRLAYRKAKMPDISANHQVRQA